MSYVEVLGFETTNTFNAQECASCTGITITDEVPRPHADENYVLKITQAKTGDNTYFVRNEWAENGFTIVGCYVRFGGTFPPASGVPNIDFLNVQSVAPANLISVRCARVGASTARWEIVDANGSVVGVSTTTGVVKDVWHRVELIFHRSVTGFATLFINGAQRINLASEDFDDGSPGVDNMRLSLLGQGGPSAIGSPTTVYFNSGYILDNASDTDDFIGNFTVRSFQPSFIGKTAPLDETGTPTGDTLNRGDFNDVSDNKTATSAQYTTTDSGGAIEFDNMNIGSTTEILAAKWMIDGGSSRVVAPNTIGEFVYGSTIGKEPVAWDVATQPLSDIFTARDNKILEVSDGKVPLWNERFVMGIYAPTIPNARMNQCWAYLLIKGSTPAYDGVTVHIKGGHIKGATIL